MILQVITTTFGTSCESVLLFLISCMIKSPEEEKVFLIALDAWLEQNYSVYAWQIICSIASSVFARVIINFSSDKITLEGHGRYPGIHALAI